MFTINSLSCPQGLEHIELFHTLVQKMIEVGILNAYCEPVLSLMPTAYGVLEFLALLRPPEDTEARLMCVTVVFVTLEILPCIFLIGTFLF